MVCFEIQQEPFSFEGKQIQCIFPLACVSASVEDVYRSILVLDLIKNKLLRFEGIREDFETMMHIAYTFLFETMGAQQVTSALLSSYPSPMSKEAFQKRIKRHECS